MRVMVFACHFLWLEIPRTGPRTGPWTGSDYSRPSGGFFEPVRCLKRAAAHNAVKRRALVPRRAAQKHNPNQ